MSDMQPIAFVKRGGVTNVQELVNAGYRVVWVMDQNDVRLEGESNRTKIATAILSGLVNIDIFKNCMTYEDSELQVTNAVAMAYRFADALIDKEQNPLAPRWIGEKVA